jgi:RNA polymerase sigma-70 factor (ECF subfamily)
MSPAADGGETLPEGAGSPPSPADLFTRLRPLLFSIAYRMLSTVSDAEDVVQDAFLRYQQQVNRAAEIDSPKAYLSAVVTRRCIDLLRTAAVRREEYPGEWLPEPLLTGDPDDDPAAQVELSDSVSMAFLLLLERLSPVERAVFLLREVFGFGYDEIASIVDKSEANCRQIAVRARQHVRADKPRFEPAPRERDRLAERFFGAFVDGDVDALVATLAEEVVVYGDGGSKAPRWPAPIVGPERVAQLFMSVSKAYRAYRITLERHEVNGTPGAVMRTADGSIVNVFALDIAKSGVRTIRSVINPDKLGHLGPVADLRAMQEAGPGGRDN